MFSKFAFVLGLSGICCGLVCAQDRDNRDAKVFKFIDQRAGNCHLSGVLTIYPDGRAHWDATTWTDSTHNKDIWHETLRVLNSQKQELFGFGVWDSPKMDSPPDGGQYNWVQEGGFPKQLFDSVDTVNSSGDC
jgi:uncharacterized protein DUF6294